MSNPPPDEGGTTSPWADEATAQIIGQTPGIVAICKKVARIASTRANVLVEGERGTGKELVARSIHAMSPRRRDVFASLHCGGFTEATLAAELFGTDEGPGNSNRGIVEKARTGTLFVNDIDELPPVLQYRLLRVIEREEFRPTWALTSGVVGLRVVAASCRDLKKEVNAGRFRRDLFQRLHAVTMRLAPLRERLADVPLLTRYFAERYAEVMCCPPPLIAPDVYEALLRHEFSDNVRELSSIMERATISARMGVIMTCDLPEDLVGTNGDSAGAPPVGPVAEEWPTLAALQRRYIDRVLARTGGNRTRAAELLGIARRSMTRILSRERSGVEGRLMRPGSRRSPSVS
jgi:DNA-binding NtrC family response regulator